MSGVGKWVADRVGGDVGKVLGGVVSVITGETALDTINDIWEGIERGYKQGGIAGALLGGGAATISAPIANLGGTFGLSETDQTNIRDMGGDIATGFGLLDSIFKSNQSGAAQKNIRDAEAEAKRREKEANTPIWLKNMVDSIFKNMKTNYDEKNSMNNYIRYQYANQGNTLGSNYIGV